MLYVDFYIFCYAFEVSACAFPRRTASWATWEGTNPSNCAGSSGLISAGTIFSDRALVGEKMVKTIKLHTLSCSSCRNKILEISPHKTCRFSCFPTSTKKFPRMNRTTDGFPHWQTDPTTGPDQFVQYNE